MSDDRKLFIGEANNVLMIVTLRIDLIRRALHERSEPEINRYLDEIHDAIRRLRLMLIRLSREVAEGELGSRHIEVP